MFKALLRRAARSCGYEIRKVQPSPAGRDWIVDLGRLLPTSPAPVLFDVGANVGVVSQRLAGAFPAPARIFAFEPAAATFTQLVAALSGHPHVQCQHLALSEKPGRFRLYHGINSQLNRLAPVGTLGDNTHEDVEVSTVDDVAGQLGLARIDVLKIDTEGFEVEVLRGAAGLLQCSAIRAIVAEATFDLASDRHTRFDEIRALLVPRGFYLHGIYDCELWGAHLKFANVLFLHEAAFPPPPAMISPATSGPARA